MFKYRIGYKAILLSLSLAGIAITSGCSSMHPSNWWGSTNTTHTVSNTGWANNSYVYHASNGRTYYQASDGRYYYLGKDGVYHYQVYSYKKNGHRYYKYYQDPNYQYINNSGLSRQVRAVLLTDPMLSGTFITVKTYKGTVRLLGTVDSYAQKQRAVRDALSVPGVSYVDDDLIVK